MDVGVFIFFLWGFEECEKFMEFYEWVFGVCMYVVYVWFGGVVFDFLYGLFDDIFKWVI